MDRVDEYVTALSQYTFSLLVLVPALLWIGIPEFDFTAVAISFGHAAFISFAAILYLKAIKISPLSKCFPMLSFSPLFVIFTAFAINGQLPNAYGVVGIVLVVTGIYSINIHKHREGWLEPFKELRREKGSWYMIGVALIYSFTAAIFKVGSEHSSPYFFSTTTHVFAAIIFLTVLLWKGGGRLKAFAKNVKGLAPVGFFNSFQILLYALAIETVIVPYAIAVKRTSIIWSILLGAIFFKEKGLHRHLVSGALIVTGLAMIALMG
jgi:drug/metabolite transporter (DMT)-like permease